MTTPLFIDGAFVVGDDGARAGGVLIEGGHIAAVAYTDDERAALRTRAGEAVDGSGHWLMPGLIDAHAHAYFALLRGTENSLPLELWSLYTTLYGRAIRRGDDPRGDPTRRRETDFAAASPGRSITRR